MADPGGIAPPPRFDGSRTNEEVVLPHSQSSLATNGSVTAATNPMGAPELSAQDARIGAERPVNASAWPASNALPPPGVYTAPQLGNTGQIVAHNTGFLGPGDFPMADATLPSMQAPPVRGRPPGRPRGSKARGTTRASVRGGRGGKRKRNDDEDDNSSGSEIYTPTAQTTKSGRSVQKPTTFVPPPQPLPQATPVYKKKKPTYRKNPESAVCKVCLRGVSPASNMIVFCDGCNTPYHQWCHKPPIDRSVIEEVDKEWFCRPCERERIHPVSEEEVLGFVAVDGVSAEEVNPFLQRERRCGR
jgi:hypothetical protein